MLTCKLHIVALPYYEVGSCLGDFLAEAMGRVMTLRPEPTNEYDAHAIRAYDWHGRHVGYVATHDLVEAWQVLRGSGRHSLRGRIGEVNAEHKCVVFECSVDTLGELEDLYPQTPYIEWTYTGPMLKPTQEMVTLEYMTDEVNERLDEYENWREDEREDFLTLATRFATLSKFDLSGDMSDYKRRLCLRLIETKDEAFAPLVEELKMSYGRSGRESHGGEVLDYWKNVLSEEKAVRSLLVHRQEYDVEKVREQLERFPEAMFQEWLENREHFIAKLLYMHIPRQVLWQLVSGIIFYETIKARQVLEMVEEERTTEADMSKSPICLSTAKGQKIDMIRVLNVMYEQGRFKGKDDRRLTKKEFFTWMGRVLNVDLSDYDKDLSRSMSDSTKLEKHTKVFDDMKATMVDIWNSK